MKVKFSAWLCLTAVILTISNFAVAQSPNEVQIGTQIWMTKNLDVSKFRNGDPIPEAKTEEEWKKAGENKQPAWCYYDNDPANGAKYGKLYNWYAVNDTRGLAPEGWRVPNDADWRAMHSYLGEESAASKMKTVSGWKQVPDMDGDGGNNQSGFSALPAGAYSGTEFYELGLSTWYWSVSAQFPSVWLYYAFDNIQIYESQDAAMTSVAYSVRCIKN
jgi:uncharacterized protein (TIGR02145 family)